MQKAVCRNCNGSGAIICKGFTSLRSRALLMLYSYVAGS
uniref:Uncharacterized protein n=1 Tax=Arundo donax TaxID=35708 RepID=A0A0A9E7Z5_ARUDO